MIVAEKPAKLKEEFVDAEMIMKRLENEIKDERFNQYLNDIGVQSQKLKTKLEQTIHELDIEKL